MPTGLPCASAPEGPMRTSRFGNQSPSGSAAMSINPMTFEPTSEISNGKKGLSRKQGTHSTAKITGTGLSDRLDVVVASPASGTATLKWTGKSKDTNAGGTECTVHLKEDLSNSNLPTTTPPGYGED